MIRRLLSTLAIESVAREAAAAERAKVVAEVIHVRERLIAMRNFIAIGEPSHADRHAKDALDIIHAAFPNEIAALDIKLGRQSLAHHEGGSPSNNAPEGEG
jgi:hypothetical protein